MTEETLKPEILSEVPRGTSEEFTSPVSAAGVNGPTSAGRGPLNGLGFFELVNSLGLTLVSTISPPRTMSNGANFPSESKCRVGISGQVHACVCVTVCIPVYGSVHVSLSLSERVFAVCSCLCVCPCLIACLCVSVRACVGLSVATPVCACLSVGTAVCMHVFVRVCVSLWVCSSVRVSLRRKPCF